MIESKRSRYYPPADAERPGIGTITRLLFCLTAAIILACLT